MKALGALVTTCVLQTGNKSVCTAAGDGMINKSGTTKRVTFSLDSKLNLECKSAVTRCDRTLSVKIRKHEC